MVSVISHLLYLCLESISASAPADSTSSELDSDRQATDPQVHNMQYVFSVILGHLLAT